MKPFMMTRQLIQANLMAFIGGLTISLSYLYADNTIEIVGSVAIIMLCLGYPTGLIIKHWKNYEEIEFDLP